MPTEKKKYPSVPFSFDIDEAPFLFCSVTEPQAYKGKDPSYSFTMGLKPDSQQLAALKAALKKVALDAFGTTEGIKFPLSLGDAKAEKQKKRDSGKSYERARGYVLFKAGSPAQYPPTLAFVSGGVVTPVTEANRVVAKKHFYAGVYGHADVSLQAYDGNGNTDPADGPVIGPGVAAYIRVVISNAHGENLGSGVNVDKWQAIATRRLGAVSAEDPTQGADASGDIPL